MTIIKKLRIVLVDVIKLSLQFIFSKNLLLSRKKKSNGIAITFDDGPHPEFTPNILEILKARNIKATFFVLGLHLNKYLDFGKMIIQDGHEIGNHTFDHIDIKNHKIKDLQKSFQKTDMLISKLQNYNKKKIIRLPYGRFDLRLLLYALRHDIFIVGWTTDPMDSFIRNPSQLIDYVESLHIKNGDILLFHEDYKHTVQALPELLDRLIARGFKFLTINEMVNQ